MMDAGKTKAREVAQARYLAQSIRLEERPPARIISGAVFLTLGMLIAALVWSGFTQVNETAKAAGEVVPLGLNVSVQHPEGGLVKTLHVRDGDHVKRGEPLLHFDDTALHSELSQIRVREAALELHAERLAALLAGRAPDFGDVGKQYPDLAAKHVTIYNAQRNTHARELRVLDAQITQREGELKRQKNQVASARKAVGLLQEQVKLRKELAGRKVVSRSELLTTQSRLAEAEGELYRAVDGVGVATSALEEARQRRLEAESVQLRDLELEAGSVAADLAEVAETRLRIKARLDQIVLHAPIDGIVQALSVGGGHAVVEPGAVILQLVPVEDDMVIDARVSPADIGHIQVGDSAEVSVDSYDTVRFGLLHGQVNRLSASTYLDDQRRPYYRARIVLDQNYLGSAERPLRVIPGMTVKVNIKTGTKTLLAYLLRPVQRGLGNAFGER